MISKYNLGLQVNGVLRLLPECHLVVLTFLEITSVREYQSNGDEDI